MAEYDSLWEIYKEAVRDTSGGENPDYWVYFYHNGFSGEEEVKLPWDEKPKKISLDGKGHVPVSASSAVEAKNKVESVPGVEEVTGADYYKNGPKMEYFRLM